MTENGSDPALAERLARLQQRRSATPSRTTNRPSGARPAGQRRKHPALGARIAAAGIGFTATFGLVAAMHLADSATATPDIQTGAATSSTTSATGVLPASTTSSTTPVVKIETQQAQPSSHTAPTTSSTHGSR